MARAYKQVRMFAVDPEIQKGLKQINEILLKMQEEEHLEILDVKRVGNIYDIFFQKTIESTEQENGVSEDSIQDDKKLTK